MSQVRVAARDPLPSGQACCDVCVHSEEILSVRRHVAPVRGQYLGLRHRHEFGGLKFVRCHPLGMYTTPLLQASFLVQTSTSLDSEARGSRKGPMRTKPTTSMHSPDVWTTLCIRFETARKPSEVCRRMRQYGLHLSPLNRHRARDAMLRRDILQPLPWTYSRLLRGSVQPVSGDQMMLVSRRRLWHA